MVSMESKQEGKRLAPESRRESASDSPDLRLDDVEDEIIDLVDLAEEGASADDAHASEDRRGADDLEVEDLGLEPETAGTNEPSPPGTSEEEMREADEALGEAEEEFQSLLRDETGELGDDIDNLAEEAKEPEEESGAGEATDLLSAEDVDTSEIFGAGPAAGEKRRESSREDASVSNEKFFEGLFDDLEVDEEGAKEVSEVLEEAPVVESSMEAEPAGGLLADLTLEGETEPEAQSPEPPGPVEELPEDLFADLDTAERTSSEPPAAAAAPFPISGESAEELMALVRDQVEAVVTRVVEQRLPVIAERIIMEEIKKIKTTME
jgi:hypothetical protein